MANYLEMERYASEGMARATMADIQSGNPAVEVAKAQTYALIAIAEQLHEVAAALRALAPTQR